MVQHSFWTHKRRSEYQTLMTIPRPAGIDVYHAKIHNLNKGKHFWHDGKWQLHTSYSWLMRKLWCCCWCSKKKNDLHPYLLGLHYVSGLTMATWKALQSIFLPLIEGLFIWTSLSGPWCGRRDGWGGDCFEQLLHIQSASVLLFPLESSGSFRKVAMLPYWYGWEKP